MNGAGELRGRKAVVTGSGRGIGQAIARRFAEEGCRVVVADIDRELAHEAAREIVAAGGAAVPIVVDVADETSVKRAFEEIRREVGDVDTLVNVAGIWAGGSLTEISVDDWDRTMAVNVRGVFLCSREVLPSMGEAKRGVILNIASTAAFKGTRRAGAYNASKAAVIGVTSNIAVDYGADGIRAIAICPGLVETEMEVQLRRFRGDSELYETLALAAHPLGRLGQPLDIAEVAAFLASDRASWITGSSFIVDGGTLV